MILRGVDIANPALNVPSYLSDPAKALYPQIDERCLDGLGKPDSFGSISPAGLVREGADIAPVTAALKADDDPDTLKISGPVLIEQGKADTTVLPNFTTALSSSLKAKVTFKTYDGVTHAGAVVDKKPSSGRHEVREEGPGLAPDRRRSGARCPRRGRSTRCSRRRRRDGPPPPSPAPC